MRLNKFSFLICFVFSFLKGIKGKAVNPCDENWFSFESNCYFVIETAVLEPTAKFICETLHQSVLLDETLHEGALKIIFDNYAIQSIKLNDKCKKKLSESLETCASGPHSFVCKKSKTDSIKEEIMKDANEKLKTQLQTFKEEIVKSAVEKTEKKVESIKKELNKENNEKLDKLKDNLEQNVAPKVEKNKEDLVEINIKLDQQDTEMKDLQAMVNTHENKLNPDHHSFNLAMPVKLQKIESMQKVDKGKSKVLFCDVLFAVPKASIIWKHKDIELTRCRNETRCIISNANSENAGEYSCIAENGVGFPKVETFTLQIIQKPEIIMKQMKYLAQIDEDLNINFEVIGTPTPTVTWYFRSNGHDTHLRNGKDYEYVCHSEQCSFKISKIKEKQLGTYVVKAENDVSSTPDMRSVKIEGSPPSNVQINVPDIYRDNDVLKAKILISAQSSTPILLYEAKYYAIGNEYWKHYLDGSQNDLEKTQFHSYQKEVFIDALNYEKEYKIEAKFQNKFGWSEIVVFTFRTNGKNYYPKNTV